MHEEFSGEKHPSLWKVLPALKTFMSKWQGMQNNPCFACIHDALDAGLATLEKYYNKTDKSPANIVCLCRLIFSCESVRSIHPSFRSASFHQGGLHQRVLGLRRTSLCAYRHGANRKLFHVRSLYRYKPLQFDKYAKTYMAKQRAESKSAGRSTPSLSPPSPGTSSSNSTPAPSLLATASTSGLGYATSQIEELQARC
jgi:hypothetical protein